MVLPLEGGRVGRCQAFLFVPHRLFALAGEDRAPRLPGIVRESLHPRVSHEHVAALSIRGEAAGPARDARDLLEIAGGEIAH